MLIQGILVFNGATLILEGKAEGISPRCTTEDAYNREVERLNARRQAHGPLLPNQFEHEKLTKWFSVHQSTSMCIMCIRLYKSV